MARVFITGLPRSGTSLLIRLLGDAPGRQAFAQPFPHLLSGVMADFLAEQGRDETAQAYPFTDDQYENYVEPTAFADFLSQNPMKRDVAQARFAAMQAYSGQQFRFDQADDDLNTWPGGDLASLVDHMLGKHSGSSDVTQVWKELAAEPLIAFLSRRGWQSIVLIRDPRDVIASMLFGKGQDQVGLPRPLLFMARQRRRSALYTLARPFGLTALRYEDVLIDPEGTLASVDGAQPVLTQALTNFSNSSFSGGERRQRLNDQQRRFVEAICFAEMLALGYTPEIEASDIEAILRAGPGPETLHRPVLERFLWSPTRANEELDRRRRLCAHAEDFQAAAFVFVEAYRRLR